MDASERFERVAEAFDNATGYPAIGKDAGSARYGGEAWQQQRTDLWFAFCAGYDFAVRIAAEHQRSDSTVRDTTGGR
jgi:hypothetical protein